MPLRTKNGFKTSTTESGPPSFKITPYQGFLALNSPKPPAPPTPPAWPPSFEIAPEPASPKRQGLFKTLLGRPSILLHALLKNPDGFEQGVDLLLQDLESGQRKYDDLQLPDQQLLDRATVDFLSMKPLRPVRRLNNSTRELPDVLQEKTASVDEEMPEAEALPTVSTFWWR